MFVLQIQEWLCLNCQTQRAISGQLGDMGKMPPAPSGPKASPMPAPAEPSSQKTPTGTQVKGKKKEAEGKTEAEKPVPEKETASIEKTPPMVTTDQKLEESEGKKSKVSALPEKKPSEEEKAISADKKERKPPAEEKPPLEEKKPIPVDKKLPPEAKPLSSEGEEKHEILKAHVQIPEEEPTGKVAAKQQPDSRPEALPGATPLTLPKAGEKERAVAQPQAEGSSKDGQGERSKEKTVSCVCHHCNLPCAVR